MGTGTRGGWDNAGAAPSARLTRAVPTHFRRWSGMKG